MLEVRICRMRHHSNPLGWHPRLRINPSSYEAPGAKVSLEHFRLFWTHVVLHALERGSLTGSI